MENGGDSGDSGERSSVCRGGIIYWSTVRRTDSVSLAIWEMALPPAS